MSAADDETKPMLLTSISGNIVTNASKESLINAFDSYVEYSGNEGHSGNALCVDASDGADFVISGGEDHSAKVWHWDSTNCSCYRLFKTLRHDSPVTSVAFAGTTGPVVTVTEKGSMRVWKLDSDTEPRPHFISAERVEDVRVKREQFEGQNDWLLATAAGKEARLIKASLKRGAVQYTCVDILRLLHGSSSSPADSRNHLEADSRVLAALHVPGNIEEGASIATLFEDVIRLWNLEGEVVAALQVPGKRVQCFTISLVPLSLRPEGEAEGRRCFSPDFSWICAGGEDTLSLWPMRNGQILEASADSAQTLEVTKNTKHEPMVQYDVPELIGDDLSFGFGLDPTDEQKYIHLLAVSRQDRTTEVLAPSMRSGHCTLSGTVGSPETGVFVKGEPRTVAVIEHDVKPTELCVRHDSDDGPVLVLSLENGSVNVCDMEGYDAGELTSDLRTMERSELLFVVLLVLVGFFQFVTFAFGPATSWSEEINRPARISEKLVLFDIQYDIDLDRQVLFWGKTLSVIAIMVIYLAITLSGTPEKIKRLDFRCTHALAVNDTRWNYFCKAVVHAIRSSMTTFVWLCSTLLVVSMFKVVAGVYDCVDPGDGSKQVALAPTVLCYVGYHKWAAIGVGLLSALYIIVLIPHALVDGDVFYIQRDAIFSTNLAATWQTWKDKAIRKATLMHWGVCHPDKDSIFVTNLFELLAKISLPVIVIETTSKPMFQTIAVAAVGLALYIQCLIYPPLVDERWNVVVQGSKLFTFLAMLCGVLTVAQSRELFGLPKNQTISNLALLVSFVSVVILVSFQRRRANSRSRTQFPKGNKVTPTESGRNMVVFSTPRGNA